MAAYKPSSVKKFIKHSKNPVVSQLIRHAAHLEHLAAIIEQELPLPLKKRCRTANYRESTLILHAESSAWTTKLRYQIPLILKNLKKYKEFKELEIITIKTMPNISARLREATAPSLSIDSADLIENLAETLSNSQLANALHRLAKRGRS